MGQSKLQAEVIGTTGMYTFCWCDLHGPQSKGQPFLTGWAFLGGVLGATKESASRYHSTDDATMQLWWPCSGQNLSNHTASSRKWIFTSMARLHVLHSPFVIE